jgi:hypothetical protein
MMLTFVEAQLAELILRGLHDLAADAIPRAAAAGVVLSIGVIALLRLHRRTARRPLPATA